MNKIILVNSSKKQIHVDKFCRPFPFSPSIIQKNTFFIKVFLKLFGSLRHTCSTQEAEQVLSASADPDR